MRKNALWCLLLALLLAPSIGRAQQKEEVEKLRQEIGKLEDQLAATRLQSAKLEKLLTALLEEQKKQGERREDELRKAQAELRKLQAETAARDADLRAQADRREQELKAQRQEAERRAQELKVVLEREFERAKKAAEAQQQVAEQKARLSQAEINTALHQERNARLELRVRELERALALKKAGVEIDPKPAPPKNPPPVLVKGKIEKIDGTDRSLVQLSIGTDAGVQLDHTLEVYRLTPRAEFLGTIRIIEATEHRAIGRLLRREGEPLRVLRVGDLVTTQLPPEDSPKGGKK